MKKWEQEKEKERGNKERVEQVKSIGEQNEKNAVCIRFIQWHHRNSNGTWKVSSSRWEYTSKSTAQANASKASAREDHLPLIKSNKPRKNNNQTTITIYIHVSERAASYVNEIVLHCGNFNVHDMHHLWHGKRSHGTQPTACTHKAKRPPAKNCNVSNLLFA